MKMFIEKKRDGYLNYQKVNEYIPLTSPTEKICKAGERPNDIEMFPPLLKFKTNSGFFSYSNIPPFETEL